MTLLQCSLIVIDEADKMSDESFGPQIATIVSELPTNRHCMLLSAPMPDAILSRLK
jgi:superfamily II DNA/RNA helicase